MPGPKPLQIRWLRSGPNRGIELGSRVPRHPWHVEQTKGDPVDRAKQTASPSHGDASCSSLWIEKVGAWRLARGDGAVVPVFSLPVQLLIWPFPGFKSSKPETRDAGLGANANFLDRDLVAAIRMKSTGGKNRIRQGTQWTHKVIFKTSTSEI